MKKTLLSILFLCACAIMNAQSITLDGVYYTIVSGEAIVDNNREYVGDGNVFIPATVEIEGTVYDVVKIKSPGFNNNQNITSLSFAENSNLKVIDIEAFSNCSNLSGPINLPKSITTLGNKAFEMTGITSLSFAEDSELNTIGSFAFDNCQNLGGQLVIPAGLTSIGGYAFAYTKITSLSFAENSVLETIEHDAFNNCTNLEFAVIPASVTSIGGGAFSVCNHLSTIVVLPATPPDLVDQAFFALGTNTVYVGVLENYPQGWGGFASVKSVGELEETIKDNALAAISQAMQGMELYDEETAIIEGYVNAITASGNFIEILNVKTDALQYIALHSQRVTAISAIDAAMQGMTLTPSETTVVNGYKAQILASASAYAIGTIRAEAVAFIALHDERSSALQQIGQAMQAIDLDEAEINHLNIYITRIETAITSAAIYDAKNAAFAYIGLHENRVSAISVINNQIQLFIELLPAELEQINLFIAEVYDAESEEEIIFIRQAAISYLTLHPYRAEAIIALESVMQGETSEYLLELKQSMIRNINSASDEDGINDAVVVLRAAISAYHAGESNVLGNLPTEGTSGPAVRISKQGKSDLILYNPDKVEFMKVEE